MKKILHSIALCLGAFVITSDTAGAQTLIHYWDFNNATADTLPNIVPVKASFSVMDTNKAQFLYRPVTGTSPVYNTYRDFTTGDVLNIRNGSAAGSCLRLRNPSDSMEGLFYIPSTGYTNIVIKYETESSSLTHGPQTQTFSYSVDSGVNWLTAGLSATSFAVDTAWSLATITFSAVADNKAGLVFRIQQGAIDTGTQGNDRYDNFSVEGSSPSSVVNVATSLLSCTLFPNPSDDVINISTNLEAAKTYTVYNATGCKISSGSASEKQKSIDISQLSQGLYFVNVQCGDKHSLLKFIKN